MARTTSSLCICSAIQTIRTIASFALASLVGIAVRVRMAALPKNEATLRGGG